MVLQCDHGDHSVNIQSISLGISHDSNSGFNVSYTYLYHRWYYNVTMVTTQSAYSQYQGISHESTSGSNVSKHLPIPHVVLQCDHGDHSVNIQSISQGISHDSISGLNVSSTYLYHIWYYNVTKGTTLSTVNITGNLT